MNPKAWLFGMAVGGGKSHPRYLDLNRYLQTLRDGSFDVSKEPTVTTTGSTRPLISVTPHGLQPVYLVDHYCKQCEAMIHEFPRHVPPFSCPRCGAPVPYTTLTTTQGVSMPRTPRAASLTLPKPLPGDIKPFLPIIIWALEALIAFLKTLQVAPKEDSL